MTTSRRILVIGHGTRGDVQPAIALAGALAGRGHDVRVLAGSNFRDLIAAHGLVAAPSSVDIEELMRSSAGQEWSARGTSQMEQSRIMRRLLETYGPPMAEDALAASRDVDVVVSAFVSYGFATAIAEARGVGHVIALVQPPMLATRDGRALMSAPLPGRISRLNGLFGRLVLERAAWWLVGGVANRFRRESLGLPAQTPRQFRDAFARTTTVLGYSRHVVPFPADWPSSFHPSGYWFLGEGRDWRPPDDLAAFLAAGPPPVYVGFGSMTGADADRLSAAVAEAIGRTGCRAVVHGGWAGLDRGGLAASSAVLAVGTVPHDWLFSRTSAVVHHGGAGTTAAGLAAGVPNVLVPHMADQPFWGRRVAALGVGPAPIHRPRLTADRLAAAIRQATTDEAMRARAAALGARIRAEDGVGEAVGIIEGVTRSRTTPAAPVAPAPSRS